MKNICLNFEETKKIALPILMVGHTPLIRGLHGIGKSQIARDLRNEIATVTNTETELIHLNCAYLHEGELGGIPYPKFNEDKGYSTNENTVFYVIDRILENDKNNKNTLLFLDEINRCSDKSVFNEFMSLINERKVNLINIPSSCYILAAGNPDEPDEDDVLGLNYLVQKMDPAVKDRMFIIDMKSNNDDWLKWATKNNIHDDIISFLSEYPEYIHNMTDVDSEQHPTPRSWEKLSDVLKYIDKNNMYTKDTIFMLSASKIGNNVALQLSNFIANKENPLLSIKDIFENSDENMSSIFVKFKNETPIRKVIITNRCINYLGDGSNKFTKSKTVKNIIIFLILLNLVKTDLLLSLINDIKDNKKLFKNLVKFDDDFITNDTIKKIIDKLLSDKVELEGGDKLKSFESLIFEFNERTKLSLVQEED